MLGGAYAYDPLPGTGIVGAGWTGGERDPLDPFQPKRTAVLSYLAVASPRGFHRRDKLAALFWPEGDQEHARASLRKTLHFLRKSLGEDAVLSRGDEEIGLDWGEITCDAIEFQEALDTGAAEGATDLYRGDLLEGFFLAGCPEFERWMEVERGRLRMLAAGAAWEIAQRHVQEGRIPDGEQVGQRALGLNGTDENQARRLIKALAAAGDRAAAVRLFERFADVLRATLDLEPSRDREGHGEHRRGAQSSSTQEGPARPDPWPSNAQTEISPVFPLPMACSPTTPHSLIQRELGPDLEILRQIGIGPGAEVYLAREKPLDRLVAVKVLSRELSQDPVARIRFEREAKAAASLNHPNAVAVHRFGWLGDEVPFLVMQYVDGPTLEEKLAAEGPLPVPEARKVLAQVAGALAEAHRSGFVHRDVSPANVLCDRETGGVLLTDFGFAGLLPKKEGPLPRVTQTGEVVGTRGYLSPEQLAGEDPTDGTDVYALGVLGYEILTGGGPFPIKSIRDAASAHLRWTPRPLTNLRIDVDEELSGLLERCLAKEPGKRPSAEFLEEGLRGPPPPRDQDRRPSGGEDVLRTLSHRRIPRIVAAAGVFGLGLLYIVDVLASRGVVPTEVFPLALDTFLCGMVAVGILAWFHGEKGPQETTTLERVVLAAVGAAWVAIAVFILLPR